MPDPFDAAAPPPAVVRCGTGAGPSVRTSPSSGCRLGLEPWRIAVLGAAILLRLSVGLSNDAIDAPRDTATGRTDKPIARGDVSLRAAVVRGIRRRARSRALVRARLGDGDRARDRAGRGVGVQRRAEVDANLGAAVHRELRAAASLVTLSADPPSLAAGVGVGHRRGARSRDPSHERAARPRGRRAEPGVAHRLGRRLSAVVAAVALVAGSGGGAARTRMPAWRSVWSRPRQW